MISKRAHWSGRIAFVLAAAGSAVGLGNIWKFPYITGVNGGGAFVLIYLACIALVGVPIFMAELYIGKKAQCNVVESFEVLHNKKTLWRFPGWLGLASSFLILSFYSVVGGWILDFLFNSAFGLLDSAHLEKNSGLLDRLFANPWRQLLWHFVFMVLTTGIVIGGIRKGLERWNKILMPALFAILALLLVRSFSLPGFGPAVEFLFSFNTANLTSSGFLEAVGHSFFTLSLGMGAILTYGSYLGGKQNLGRIAFIVAFMDTGIALIAGLVIFSVVFTFNLEPGKGPGLIFETLPTLFAQMPGGYIISLAFFMLISFAALTSSVSMLEVVVAYWDETHNMHRTKGSILSGSAIFLLGLLTVFSTNLMAEVKVFGLTFFDLFDKMTSSYFLPIGGMAISLFFGWILGPKAVEEILGPRIPKAFHVGLLWCTRLAAPLAVLAVLIYNLK